MAAIALRPLTPGEAAALKVRRVPNPLVGWLANLLFLLILGMILWAITYWAILKVTASSHAAIAAVILVAIPYLLWVVREVVRDAGRQKSLALHLRRRNALLAEDLAAGVLEVRTYRANDAIEVQELEDEGNHYFLHLDDGTVLFLSGQYLYNSEEEPNEVSFPCSEFDLVIAPKSKTTFELIRRGSHIRPSKRLKPFRREQHLSKVVPEDSEILTIPWSEIADRFS